ncbi:MAG: hypothetical protein Tsb0020_55810 [Haliangiales bacterium]
MATREQRILEELIYDRVRSNVNLCQLIVIEQELDDSIQRALGGSADDADDGADDADGADGNDRASGDRDPDGADAALAAACLERAWSRLEREWRRLRRELGCELGDEPPAIGGPVFDDDPRRAHDDSEPGNAGSLGGDPDMGDARRPGGDPEGADQEALGASA